MVGDLNWEDGDAAHFSAWLLPMLVTNPQARATAAQSACHPFLEPMDLVVEEGKMLGTSSSSSCSSAQIGGVLGDKVADLEEQIVKIKARCDGEVSRLEAKVEQVAEANVAETNLVSKLKAEVVDLKAEKEAEKAAADALKQRLVILESKFENLTAEDSLESEERTTRLEAEVAEMKVVMEEQELAVEELKQKQLKLKLRLQKLKGDIKTCKRKQMRSELREIEAFENGHQKSDLENNAKAEQVAVKAEAKEHPTKKKSLVEMMQKKLNSGQDLTRTRACQAPEVLEKVKTESEVACAQLVISNIKVPCSIVAQTKLLRLVKKTGTLVEYRFS